MRFLIVDAPSAYNILLGRPSLNAIKAIPSAYHMMIKFPTIGGVGMVRGAQCVAKECYSASMKQKEVGNVYMDELNMLLMRPNDIYKFKALLPEDYCLIPGNGAIKLVDLD